MTFNPKTVEQKIELKDGRTIFKTDNGFKSWVTTAKGETSQVTDAYYNKTKRLRK